MARRGRHGGEFEDLERACFRVWRRDVELLAADSRLAVPLVLPDFLLVREGAESGDGFQDVTVGGGVFRHADECVDGVLVAPDAAAAEVFLGDLREHRILCGVDVADQVFEGDMIAGGCFDFFSGRRGLGGGWLAGIGIAGDGGGFARLRNRNDRIVGGLAAAGSQRQHSHRCKGADNAHHDLRGPTHTEPCSRVAIHGSWRHISVWRSDSTAEVQFLNLGSLGRIRPSCVTEATSLPASVKTSPRLKPRAPEAEGESIV